MRPVTDTLPKPLLQIGGLSLIEHHLRMLSTLNFRKVVINISYMHELILDYFKKNTKFDIEIIFSVEADEPLGTAGGVRNALPYLNDEQLLVINGDVLIDTPPTLMALPRDTDIHMYLVPNPEHNPDGDFSFSGGMPKLKDAEEPVYTFSGIALYRTSLFETLPSGFLALGPILQSTVKNKRASAEIHTGLWIDIGTVQRYEYARKLFDRAESSNDKQSCSY